MGEFKAEKPAADFLDEFAGSVEFKEPVVVAPMEHEYVALGIGRYCYGFAQILAWREFQEIRCRSKRNLGDILNGRLPLRKRRHGPQYGQSDRCDKNSFHGNLLHPARTSGCHCMRTARPVEAVAPLVRAGNI